MRIHYLSRLTRTLITALLHACLGTWLVSANVPYAGGMYTENFDSMGSGTATPLNWFVGIGADASQTAVTVSDGSTGPTAGVAAYNFGAIAGPDRALGVLPAAGDRNIETRIQNATGRNITSFTVRYDGEQWRIGNMPATSMLVLRFSVDGVNYVDMGASFAFTPPRTAAPPLLQDVAIDGNSPANRVAAIGGTYTPATPVPPSGTIYLRWVDADASGNDPALAVDNFSFTVGDVGGPPIEIRNNHDGTVTLSWAFPSAGFLLESKNDLSTQDWLPVADGVDVPAGGMHHVTVNTALSNHSFFRLNSPVTTP
jgi:hypothetical protein